jgi:hypothetical protein
MEDVYLDGMIILKSVLKKYDNMCCKLIGFRIRTVSGSRDEGNEIFEFHHVKEFFFDQQSSCYFKITTLFHRVR